MVNKVTMWHTWSGARSDISRATQEAADAITSWGNYPAHVEVSVTYKSGLTEDRTGVGAIDEIFRSDLPLISELSVRIKPDRNAYYEEEERLRDTWREDADERIRRGEEPAPRPHAPPLTDASVALRFGWGVRGLRLEVEGPDRDRVEGLHTRLMQILTTRAAFRRIDPQLTAGSVGGLLVVAFPILASVMAHWLGFAKTDHKWQPAEIVAPALGVVLALVLALTFLFIYPRLEIVDEGEKTRAERFRGFLIAAVVAVVLGIISSVIYGVAAR